MELLSDFEAPNLTRLIWHSEKARQQWEPVIGSISAAWHRAERESVGTIRTMGQQWLTRDEYLELLPWALSRGLSLKIRQWTGNAPGFSHSYPPGNDRAVVLIAAGDPSRLDDPEPERNFGYPKCCQDFFETAFPTYRDPIWQWAGERESVRTQPAMNPVLRYIGVRAVPWIPCSWSCGETLRAGGEWFTLLRQCGALHEPLIELLSSPTTWDCYRGVAIVSTPWFRIVVGSVPTSRPYVVRINYALG